MTAAFQPQAALQMKIANSLKSELSAGKGLKAVFGSRRKRRDSEVLRLAGELTQSADNFVASWELDQNSARMYTLLLHAYNASIGAYMETGAYDRALEASFRLLMNVRYATYGTLPQTWALFSAPIWLSFPRRPSHIASSSTTARTVLQTSSRCFSSLSSARRERS